MKTGLVFLCAAILTFSFEASHAGPIVVGGGAGESEFSIVFARTNLPAIVTDCLKFSCRFTPQEAERLAILGQKAKTAPLALFKSSKGTSWRALRISSG